MGFVGAAQIGSRFGHYLRKRYVRSQLLTTIPVSTKAISRAAWFKKDFCHDSAMVRRMTDPDSFNSKNLAELANLRKDLVRNLKNGCPRTRGGGQSQPYTDAQLDRFKQQLTAVETAQKAK